MKNSFEIKAIIFDLDGTLVDSKLDFDKMRLDIGIPYSLPILEFVESSNDEDFKKFAYTIIHDHELKGAQSSTPIRDADSFLEFLTKNNFPIAIVTRNSLEVTNLTIEKFNWNFNLVLTRDCAPAKPKPDAIIKIANNFDILLENILFIGDHDFDLETAKNAKCISGLITHHYNQNLTTKADLCINNFKEIIPYLCKDNFSK